MQDYILVKDKDGRMKYFKDGKFFEIGEIEEKKIIKQEIKKVNIPESVKETSTPKPLPSPILRETKALEIKKEVATPSNPPESVKSVAPNQVQAVIDKLKIRFSEDSIKTRFVNILTTYFNGVRTVKEVEYVLTLPKASGGMELPIDKAKLVVAVLGQQNVGTKVEVAKPAVVKAVELQPSVDMEHRLGTGEESVKSEKSVGSGSASDGIKKLEKIMLPVDTYQFKPAAKPVENKPLTPKMVENIQPKMTDIKRMSPRLTGPVEELASLDLANFRKLGKDRAEIVAELSEKFQLLSDESLTRKIEGINAWRQSPVFRMYLQMSMQGIQEKKTIDGVIEFRQRANKDTLTLSEFEAINEINRMVQE